MTAGMVVAQALSGNNLKNRVYFGSNTTGVLPDLKVPYTGTPTEAVIDRNYPTSTLDPILQAVRAGAEMVEFDAHLVENSRLMVKPKYNAEMEKNGLEQYYLNSRMATLDEVFDVLPGHVTVMLELKSKYGYFPKPRKTFEKTLVDFIKTRDVADRMMIVGFSPPLLARLKKVAKKAGFELQTGNEVYFPRYQGAEESLSDKAHRRGLPYINWVAGLTRKEEAGRFVYLTKNGADGLVTNMSEGFRQHLEENAANSPKFSGKFSRKKGKRGQDNIYPNAYIKHVIQRNELEKHWDGTKAGYDRHLNRLMQLPGFGQTERQQIHQFMADILKFPKGMSLEMSDDAFHAYAKKLSAPEKERANYALERFGIFWVDHFGSIFEHLKTKAQWQKIQWFYQGLMQHPYNQHVMLSAKPIGLVTRPLGHALELENNLEDKSNLKSPYWSVFEQLVDYMENTLDNAFLDPKKPPVIIEKSSDGEWLVSIKTPDDEAILEAYLNEQTRFANVLYELMMNAPIQHRTIETTKRFIEKSLPEILNTFHQNFPPPQSIVKDATGQWQGHPEYFEQLQQNILNNVVRLIQKTDITSQQPVKPRLPHGEQQPAIIAHGPLNHLYWPPKQEVIES